MDSNPNPPAIRKPQKLKKRPMSAMESSELEKGHGPSGDVAQFPLSNFKTCTSLSGITPAFKSQVPFLPAYPSNNVKKIKTIKVSGSKASNPSATPATLSTIPMLSSVRKANPVVISSPLVTPTAATSPRATKAQSQRPSVSRPRTPKKKPELVINSAGNGAGTRFKVTLVPEPDYNKPQRSRLTEGVSVKPPNPSTYAKSAAQSVINSKARGNKANANPPKPFVKTQIVLAPRFGTDSEHSTFTMVPDEAATDAPGFKPPGEMLDKQIQPQAPGISSINFSVQPMADFSPEKSRWVKMALGKLGKTWAASGVVPQYMMDFPEFQSKIGDLYDMAVDKKCNQLKSSRTGRGGRGATPEGKLGRRKNSKSKSKDSVDSGDSIPEDVQKKMSDIILHLLLTKFMPPKDEEGNEEGDNGEDMRMKSHSWKRGEIIETAEVAVGVEDAKVRKQIINCHVFEGKIYSADSADSGHKTKHSFACLSESRRRAEPNGEYFRRVADLRGFEPEEVTMRYTNTRIFVEGRQPHKGEQNARQVREIIALPKTVGIQDLKVMRGKKGLLVFEQVSNSQS